jgi:hypothetical protein
MLSVAILSVIILSVIMVSAIILRVVFLSVMGMLVFLGSLAAMPNTNVFDNLATLTRIFKEASVR